MHDHELLELAAKAAGYSVHGWINDRLYLVDPSNPAENFDPFPWNPLTDDGDALRVAVRLNLRVMPQDKCVYVESNPDSVLGFSSVSEIEMNGIDPYAATRRAIVRAAAEIGRQR